MCGHTVVPMCCYPRTKAWISPKRPCTCAIEKALMGNTMSVKDNRCGDCMSSMRSGQGDMVRDLLRGVMHAP